MSVNKTVTDINNASITKGEKNNGIRIYFTDEEFNAIKQSYDMSPDILKGIVSSGMAKNDNRMDLALFVKRMALGHMLLLANALTINLAQKTEGKIPSQLLRTIAQLYHCIGFHFDEKTQTLTTLKEKLDGN